MSKEGDFSGVVNPTPDYTGRVVGNTGNGVTVPRPTKKGFLLAVMVVMGLAFSGFLIALLVLIRKPPPTEEDGKCRKEVDHSLKYMALFMLIICVLIGGMAFQSYRTPVAMR